MDKEAELTLLVGDVILPLAKLTGTGHRRTVTPATEVPDTGHRKPE